MVEISDESYEELQQILERQYGQAFTLEEVKEVGDGLVDSYALLTKLYYEEQKPKADQINPA